MAETENNEYRGKTEKNCAMGLRKKEVKHIM